MNPDFGQVEADPAEVNLSAFETFFDERRPFFVEGANLLTGNVDELLLFAPHRRAAGGRGRRRLRRLSGDDHDPRRGQADRPPRVGHVDRHARRGDRRGVGADLQRVRSSAACAWRRGRPTAWRASSRSSVRLDRPSVSWRRRVNRRFAPDDPLAGAAHAQRLHAERRFGDALRRLRDARATSASRTSTASLAPSCGCSGRARATSSGPTSTTFRSIRSGRSMTGAKGGLSFERQNGRHWLWQAATILRDARLRDQRHRPAHHQRRHADQRRSSSIAKPFPDAGIASTRSSSAKATSGTTAATAGPVGTNGDDDGAPAERVTCRRSFWHEPNSGRQNGRPSFTAGRTCA